MKRMKALTFILLIFVTIPIGMTRIIATANPGKTRAIHVYVALCDNKNQGIVKVSPRLGNGKNPHHNLYWGAAYGIKSYFNKSQDWKLIKTTKHPKTNVLERIIFKNRHSNTYLLADAYDGANIKQTVIDFLKSSAGDNTETVCIGMLKIQFGGNSDLIAYIGHNGLMDFSIDEYPERKNSKRRDIIILACYSKMYFETPIKKTGANPLIWTSGLIAPEAYTLELAVKGWILGETNEQIRLRAARAYNHYQKCGLKRAKRLLLTGW
jgi:hypothetical protein